MKLMLSFIAAISLSGCYKNTKDAGEITVMSSTIKKRQIKTHDQFIQIAYIDLFNKTIEPQRLSGVKNTFDSQGDDDLNYRLFVKEIIEEAAAQLPPDSVMKEEPEVFIDQSYLKFFGRYPNGYEKKVLVDDIKKDTSISVGKIYYILMTSEEYRLF